MIDCGVDVNHVDNEGVTPLFYSVRSGYLPLVKLLINNGALVNHADVKGVTAYGLCKMTNASWEISDLLLKNGAAKLELQKQAKCSKKITKAKSEKDISRKRIKVVHENPDSFLDDLQPPR